MMELGPKARNRGTITRARAVVRAATPCLLALGAVAAYAGVPRLDAASAPAAPRAAPQVRQGGAPPAVSAAAVDLVAREIAAQKRGSTQPPARAARALDSLEASPAEYQGGNIFHVYCYRCHGVDAMGSDLAPNLRHSVGPEGSVTHDVFITTVTNGRLEKGMPSWKELLDRDQMENVYAYLKARSSGRLAPGRPHLKQQG